MNGSDEAVELKRMLQNESRIRKETEEEANRLRSQLEQFMQSDVCKKYLLKMHVNDLLCFNCKLPTLALQDGGVLEIFNLRRMLEDEIDQKRKLEEEVAMLRSQLLQMTFNSDQVQ